MLVLTRKVGETIVIKDDIRLTVLAIRGDQVRFGITAPKQTVVDRQEIHEIRMARRGAPRPPPPGEAAK